MYNKIGVGYNTTRKADPHIAGRLFSLLAPENGKTYMDIGCGTGNYTIKLSEMGADFIGVELSELMLEEARSKSDLVTWVHGNAESIPLANSSIDGAVGTLTIHHWGNLERGFSEVARVLKPGSLFVIFSFTPEQKQGYWLNHFFPEIMERSRNISVPLTAVNNAATKAGMTIVQTEKYFVKDDVEDMFGYCGKNNPELYFDPLIRKGISWFSTLKNKDEETNGLRHLRESIDTGEFEQIRKQYENEEGDYLFIVLRKG